ncbi:hypothetical protein AVEN_4460-1 [Araneus ventricosus]|uniref:Uncharacterized protein n=1 Tax=Araneus ventricosus TaxID=182803 RepID=A0A4Y2WSJ9_ARAVE|nr:hypothetical protein AVEN_4460-1 [Araneus ventricosus]
MFHLVAFFHAAAAPRFGALNGVRCDEKEELNNHRLPPVILMKIVAAILKIVGLYFRCVFLFVLRDRWNCYSRVGSDVKGEFRITEELVGLVAVFKLVCSAAQLGILRTSGSRR